ncbi:hypothetical protein KW787_03575 [Candidatus Pacearchaeota archaeon]|nr:hypothetical protein [Candidatus Pacearchaeota archaeon]
MHPDLTGYIDSKNPKPTDLQLGNTVFIQDGDGMFREGSKSLREIMNKIERSANG